MWPLPLGGTLFIYFFIFDLLPRFCFNTCYVGDAGLLGSSTQQCNSGLDSVTSSRLTSDFLNWCFSCVSNLSHACCMPHPFHPIFRYANYTGRFIMFSVITNIYNKKTKGRTLMELFTATGKLKKFFFWQLKIFDVCTTGDTAHIDTVLKFLAHTRQHVDACVARTWISYRCVPCHPWCTHRTSLVVKKIFFSFLVTVNNSINVRPLVVLL